MRERPSGRHHLGHAICLQVPRLRHRRPDPGPGGRDGLGGLRSLASGSRTATASPRPSMEGDTLQLHRGARVHDPRHQRAAADPARRAGPADHLLLRQGPRGCEVGRRCCSAASSSRSRSGIFAHGLPALGFIHGFWALLLFGARLPHRQAGRRRGRRAHGHPRRPPSRDHPRPGPGPGRSRSHPGDRRAAGGHVVGQPRRRRRTPPWTWGEMDYGGGPRPAGHRHGSMRMAAGAVSVKDLDTPKGRKADVVVTSPRGRGR